MNKEPIKAFEDVSNTINALGSHGALLVAGAEPVNPMTIGWGLIGPVWGKPTFAVLVRPSRYTYELMERAERFSVNVPPATLREACSLCGTKSGRHLDKIAAAGLTAEPGRSIPVPTIAECPVHYECAIVHRNEVDPASLVPEINDVVYRSGDVHVVYWGRIVGAYRSASA
jgi:flavin reductase (DIM6/NTAB) family NADH-FMN oxidoreductase RutF